jgi:hypothetical protein
LHMPAEEIIPTSIISNIYIKLCHPKALTLTQIRSYALFEVALLGITDKNTELQGNLTFRLLRHEFPYRLGREILLKVEVLLLMLSYVRTPPPHLRRAILVL